MHTILLVMRFCGMSPMKHKSWFTPASLVLMLEGCGFEVLDVYTCWKEEFLAIEAKPGLVTQKENHFLFENDIFQFREETKNFQIQVERIKEENGQRLKELDKKGINVAMWGAESTWF